MREYLLCLAAAAAVTYLVTPFARALAIRYGAMADVRDRDVHIFPTPRWGGLAMLVGLLVAFILSSQLPLMLAAGTMAMQGVTLVWLPIRGTFILDSTTSVLLTVLVVLVSINAVNMVDGLDGLAASIVMVGSGAFFAYSYFLSVANGYQRAALATLVSAALIGMCAGFLPHNRYRAKVFMGDTGSMLIGLLMAASSIMLTGQVDPGGLSNGTLLPAFLPIVLPLSILAIPLLDLLLAVIRRTRKGRSPFSPDKEHLHHRLLKLGHGQERAVLIMTAFTGLIAFGAVSTAFVPVWVTGLGAALGMVVLASWVLNPPRSRTRTIN